MKLQDNDNDRFPKIPGLHSGHEKMLQNLKTLVATLQTEVTM